MRLVFFLTALAATLPGSVLAAESEPFETMVNRVFGPYTKAASDFIFWGFEVGGVTFPLVVIWLIAGALFFTVYMKFINLRGFRQSLRIVSGKYDNPKDPGEVTHFQALSAALSGTVGLGNIAGVAIAISVGGPGATFWMILAGFLGMTSKFVECTLGVKYREIDENGVVSGGPMYYLSKGLAKRGLVRLGVILAALSALSVIGGAVGSGAFFQINQAAALVILFTHMGQIPDAFIAIFRGAFSPDGITGGFIGVIIIGIQRATFSNEAGLGSAPIAHAAAKTKEPVAEGLVALLEPFIDTVVVCTMTALVIIIVGGYEGATEGITLTSRAFASVISWFPYVLMVAAILFAFSTSITWYYYGERSFVYLSNNSGAVKLAYKISFIAALIIGSSMTLNSIFDFAAAMLFAMAIPNMIGLYIMAPEVRRMLKSYLARVKSGEIKAVK